MMQNVAMVQESVLLIGIGNPLRGDDRAGWLLAEQLAAAWAAAARPVTLRLVQQLGPELAEELAELRPTAVLFCDAAAGQTEPAIRALAPRDSSLGPPAATPTDWPGSPGSHHLDPTWVLTIAHKLYGFACPAWLATVPAVAFPHGDTLSPTALAGVAAALPLVHAAVFRA